MNILGAFAAPDIALNTQWMSIWQCSCLLSFAAVSAASSPFLGEFVAAAAWLGVKVSHFSEEPLKNTPILILCRLFATPNIFTNPHTTTSVLYNPLWKVQNPLQGKLVRIYYCPHSMVQLITGTPVIVQNYGRIGNASNSEQSLEACPNP